MLDTLRALRIAQAFSKRKKLIPLWYQGEVLKGVTAESAEGAQRYGNSDLGFSLQLRA